MQKSYYYEKHYHRSDGITLVRSFSRSFQYGDEFNPITGEYIEKIVKNNNTPEQLHLDLYPDQKILQQKKQNSLQSSMSRARNTVKTLAFSNPDLIGMLTLTNADCPTEDEALRRFKNFQQKVRRAGYITFKFLGVKELQKRGSIHWHLLVNLCPGEAPSPNNPKKRISTLWTYGYSDFVKIKGDNMWRTELYLLKYMTKNHLKLFRQYYVRSRNLDLIQPDRLTITTPIPLTATNVFQTVISNDFIDNFVITDYTVDTSKLNRRIRPHAQSKHRSP